VTILAWLWRAAIKAKRDTVFLAAGVPLHLAFAPMWITLLVPKRKALGLGVTLVLLMPLLTLALTSAQRLRYRGLRGMTVPRSSARGGPRGPRRVLAWLRSADTWRHASYHAVAGPGVAVMELGVLAWWAAGTIAASLFVWAWVVPFSWRPPAVLGAYVTVAGVLLLATAPWLSASAARTETRLAGALLGPGRAERLRRRVEDLTESRAGMVDAADAERRRIERDLHDGAQQRLVSLALNLGLAKATLTHLPPEARQVIDHAHAEAKEAIEELGHLVRGLHPPVLADRGLDAALPGLAARVPLPVRLRVSLASRPSPSVEAVAYFLVSEALTNVTKHSGATEATVTAEGTRQVLRVTVTDNGGGGADPAAGTGLAGLAKRVRSVDGTFGIESPRGGPTVITAELPCGR
jgi:signal transduction histidine kinase